MIKVGNREEKHPEDMVNIELLEKYGHYNRMTLRLQNEQDYTILLRQEMLKRMKGESVAGIAESIKESEKILREISNELKTWDAENPNPTGFMREEVIDAYFMDWLRNSAHTHSNKDLGLIVRQVVGCLEDL